MLCRHFVFYNTIFRAALCVVPTYDIAAVSLRHVVFSLFTITSSILRKLHPLKQHHGPLCINDSSRRGICSGRRWCLPHTAIVDTSSYHQIAPHGIIISWTAERNHRRKRRKGTTMLWRFCTLLLAIGRRCCGGGCCLRRWRSTSMPSLPSSHAQRRRRLQRWKLHYGDGRTMRRTRTGGASTMDERTIESIANMLLERPYVSLPTTSSTHIEQEYIM